MTPEQFSALRRALSGHLVQMLVTLFRQLGSWRATDRDVFLHHALPLVEGAQRQLAVMTASYVASQASAALGRVIAPPGIPDDASKDLRRGVDTLQVYGRPFVEIYTALSKGRPLTTAVDLGETRLREIAELDMQQTYAEASRAAMRELPPAAQPRSWRRVLVGEENCAMCIVASTQRYHVETLNPIHPACDCRVEPIYGKDPGQVIEPELLEKVHNAVHQLTGAADRGGRAPDYRKIIVEMTHEHGELGPMLARPLDHFTSEGDL
ncbi:hypothetical protein ACWEOE_28955 [Amycolatopsis sp. NPDC004368]